MHPLLINLRLTITSSLILILIFPIDSTIWAARLTPPCSSSNGVQECGPAHTVLPEGVCLWQQGIIQHNTLTGASRPDCIFEVRDPEFLKVIGKNPKLELLAHADAHEGGVYFPDKEEFYFSSTRQTNPPNIKLGKLSLATNDVTIVMNETLMTNGMVLDASGQLLVCQQGKGSREGFIQRINLHTGHASIVADNWFGLPFNSPNDVVVKSDGSIWFTDPDYGWVQGFKANPPRINNQVYWINKWGVVDVVADGFTKPNGLAFSHDEKKLYVTDTGSSLGDGSVDVTRPHSIYVFDVNVDGKTLSNRRLFASMASFDGSYPGVAAPDGIKVDTRGRVYVANPDGIQVFKDNGEVIGLIRVHGSANMGFVGENLNRLLILNDTAINAINLQAKGANLFYAMKYAKTYQ